MRSATTLRHRGAKVTGKAPGKFPPNPRTAAADALRQAAPSLKALVYAGAGSTSSASRWWTDAEGSPVLAHDLLLTRLAARPGGAPGVLISHARATLAASLMPLSDADLVARFWATMNREAVEQGAGDVCESGFYLAGDIAELERCSLREAGVLEERAAICRELRARGLDPRSKGDA